MTLHTRIFGVKLGLILGSLIIVLVLTYLMTNKLYPHVISFFIGMAAADYLEWRNRK